MPGFVESATALMTIAEQRLEVTARNIANISTSGYKKSTSFVEVLRTADAPPTLALHRDDGQGRFEATGDPFDLAIGGSGWFRLRDGEAVLLSRQGHFRRDADGAFVTSQGQVLQRAGGGDLIAPGEVSIALDGTVIADGQPVARIAVERPADSTSLRPVGDSTFAPEDADALEAVDDPVVRQGMVETANVSLAEEMTQSMAALREAESGARLIQLYDELMGRVASAFGQGAGR